MSLYLPNGILFVLIVHDTVGHVAVISRGETIGEETKLETLWNSLIVYNESCACSVWGGGVALHSGRVGNLKTQADREWETLRTWK